jgi:voltage-gated potassium channel
METLRNHVIVCGAGPTALYILEELEEHKTQLASQPGGDEAPGNDYLLIEPSAEAVERLVRRLGPFRFLTADPTDDQILEQAGIGEAYGIFPVMHDEKDNLYLAIAARQKNPGIRIVASTVDPFASGRKFASAGANAVISPNFLGGLRLVSEAVRPAVTAFLDELLRDKNPDLLIYEVEVRAGAELCGHTLAQLELPRRTGLLVLAFLPRGAAQHRYNPGAATVINEGDVLVVMGSPVQFEVLHQLTG